MIFLVLSTKPKALHMPGTKLHPQRRLHVLLSTYIRRVRSREPGLRPEEASLGGNARSGQGQDRVVSVGSTDRHSNLPGSRSGAAQRHGPARLPILDPCKRQIYSLYTPSHFENDSSRLPSPGWGHWVKARGYTWEAERRSLTWRTPSFGAGGGGRHQGYSHGHQDPGQP